MKRLLSFVIPLIASIGTLSAQFDTSEAPLMGTYEGKWKVPGEKGKFKAQVRALGNGNYDGFLQVNKSDQPWSVVKIKSVPGGSDPNVLVFKSSPLSSSATNYPEFSAHLELRKKKLKGSLEGGIGPATLKGKKKKNKSPTLKAKAPRGARIIFDGKDRGEFRNFTWDLVEGGAMQVKQGDLIAKEKLNDFELHVEFRTPFMPKSQGQARGNSGVYLQSLYEVQVLDSFGLYPLQINDCGSIYKIKTAPGNACFPPGEWQTYDIIFRNGAPGKTPVITVLHNGIKTIDEAVVPADVVGKGGGGGTPDGGFLKLQNHGNPVQFRNIWVVPLK